MVSKVNVLVRTADLVLELACTKKVCVIPHDHVHDHVKVWYQLLRSKGAPTTARDPRAR